MDVVHAGGAEGADEGGGETGVGEEGNVEVDGRSSDSRSTTPARRSFSEC